jgi:glutamate synthase (NADPH/NADH) small chain
VAVIGAGLVAVDAALEAVKEGHTVHMISIENQFDAPAGTFEINRLKKTGVEHSERAVIKRVLGEGKVESIELIDVDAEVKGGVILKLEQIPGTERIVDGIDNIVVGIGQIPTPPFKKGFPEVKTLKWGGIEVNDRSMSSKEKVFATGDVATGVSKVGRAYQTGLKTAYWVDRYFQDAA